MAVDQAYQVVEVPGKGRGLVATRTLEAGELVLSEKMFLKLDSNSAKDTSVFQKLDPEIKEKLDKKNIKLDFASCNLVDSVWGSDQVGTCQWSSHLVAGRMYDRVKVPLGLGRIIPRFLCNCKQAKIGL